MSRVLVDSNLLIDVLSDDARWAQKSMDFLIDVALEHTLLINAIVFSEISIGYETLAACERALKLFPLLWEDIPKEAAFLAGQVFLRYRKGGGAKSLPLPDFFIGAHAQIAGYSIATRDPRPYRHYYSKVDLLTL
jgi:predicted nucleic acid-binding protein